MERLTFEGNFCDIAQCRELPCPYNGACSQRKVYDRLRAGWPPERALFERVSLNKYEHQKKALEAMKDD